MNKNELQHIGVLGMKWGHRKSGDRAATNAARAEAHSKALKLGKELEGLRKQRKMSTKVTDALLSGAYTGKLFSEKHSNSELAKKSSKVHDQLSEARRLRSRGQVIGDYLMTVNRSTQTWSEMSPGKKRKAIGYTIAAVGILAAVNHKDLFG